MENTLALRVIMLFVITIAGGAAALGFINLKFPENAIVIGLSAAAIAGFCFFVARREKAARYDVYFKTVEDLGKPLSFSQWAAAFERDGTRFDVAFPNGEHHPYFKVSFPVPHLMEKFSVQSKSIIIAHHDDCYYLPDEDSPLPDFRLMSRDPAFLLRVLENRRFRDELLNYSGSMWTGIYVLLEDGIFELRWTPPVSEQIDGFYGVCCSAAVFHDELKKISAQ